MNGISPLKPEILFHAGPVPISNAVVVTWGLMAALVLVSWLATRRATVRAGSLQAAAEIVVEAIAQQAGAIMHRDAWAYVPLVGTLFLFLLVANLSVILPGVKPPTAHLETAAALALIVFVSVHVLGVRARGLSIYLRHYLRPNPLMLPLNLLSEITRIFSLMVRLFGNMMSHEIVVAIVVLLAGLLVPVPFMLLGVLIGVIQAYIFTVLATVYIGAAVGSIDIE